MEEEEAFSCSIWVVIGFEKRSARLLEEEEKERTTPGGESICAGFSMVPWIRGT